MRCELKLSRLNAQAGVSSAQVTCTVTRQLGGDGLEPTARQAGVCSHGRGPKDTQQSREITDGQLYFASFFGRCISEFLGGNLYFYCLDGLAWFSRQVTWIWNISRRSVCVTWPRLHKTLLIRRSRLCRKGWFWKMENIYLFFHLFYEPVVYLAWALAQSILKKSRVFFVPHLLRFFCALWG